MSARKVGGLFQQTWIVWTLLLAATALTGLLAEMGQGRFGTTAIILVIASAKIGAIMAWFMELRHAPRAWQAVFAGWLLAVTAIVVTGFAVAP